jgi:hypothetical protein
LISTFIHLDGKNERARIATCTNWTNIKVVRAIYHRPSGSIAANVPRIMLERKNVTAKTLSVLK